MVPLTDGPPPNVAFEGPEEEQSVPFEGGTVLELPGVAGDVPLRGFVPFCGVPGGDPIVPGFPPDEGQSVPFDGGAVLELPGIAGDVPLRGFVPFCGVPGGGKAVPLPKDPPNVEFEGGKGQGVPFEGGAPLEFPGAPSEDGAEPIHELMVSSVLRA